MKTKISPSKTLLSMAMAMNNGSEILYEPSVTSLRSGNEFKKSSTYGSGKTIEVRTEPKIGRNDICPKCDSGKKFKKCCIDKD